MNSMNGDTRRECQVLVRLLSDRELEWKKRNCIQGKKKVEDWQNIVCDAGWNFFEIIAYGINFGNLKIWGGVQRRVSFLLKDGTRDISKWVEPKFCDE